MYKNFEILVTLRTYSKNKIHFLQFTSKNKVNVSCKHLQINKSL